MRFNANLLVLFFLFVGCSHASKPIPPPTPNGPPPSPVSTTGASVHPESQRELATCRRVDDIRLIEIELTQPKGCKVWYSKDGKRVAVASSTIGSSHCEQVQQRIQRNLESADFKCVTGKVSQNPTSP